jgi:general secretion pathway protein A
MVVTGGIGTGKRHPLPGLLAELGDDTASALIFNPPVRRSSSSRPYQEFGLRLAGRGTRKRYLDALNTFLLQNFAAGKNTVLMIDEAQNLSHPVLEQIRLLSNLETVREKLIQIVLLGQPELRQLLALPSLRQLNERITVRYHLSPLARADVGPYIAHRLATAGAEKAGELFGPETCGPIYRHSRGIPRRINAICDRALLIAYGQDRQRIDKGLVRQAVKDIGPDYLSDPLPQRWRWRPWLAPCRPGPAAGRGLLWNANLLDGMAR